MERFDIAESYVNGLRSKIRTNVKTLELCVHAKPSEVGLLPIPAITDVDNNTDLVDDWPFPQVVNCGADIVSVSPSGTPSILLPSEDGLYIHSGHLPALTAISNPYGPIAVGSTGDGPVIRAEVDEVSGDEAWVQCVVVDSVNGTVYSKRATNVISGDVITFWSSVYPNSTPPNTFTITVTTDNVATTLVDQGTSQPLLLGYVRDLSDMTGDNAYTKPFHSCHIGPCWFMTNGEYFIYRCPAGGDEYNATGGVTGYRARFVSAKTLAISTVCTFGRRLYIAGFNADDAHFNDTWTPSDAYHSWEYLWDTWIKSCDLEFTHQQLAMGKNIVMFSRPEGGDFFDAFTLELSMLGIPDSNVAFEQNYPYMLDAIRKQEMGFFEVPTNGTILRILPHGDKLVIYCTDGIYVAIPQVTEIGLRHIVEKISTIKIHQVATDEHGLRHIFLTTKGRLCVMENATINDLDYRNQFEAWIVDGGEPVVTMATDDEEHDVFICGAAKSFVFTRTGLGESLITTSGVTRIEGELTGANAPLTAHAYYDTDTIGLVEYIKSNVITEVVDFNERMMKDLHRLEFLSRSVENLECRVHYRVDGLNWRVTPWFLVVESGMTTPVVSGHDLKLEFRFAFVADTGQIEYSTLNWRRNDKRNLRMHTVSFGR